MKTTTRKGIVLAGGSGSRLHPITLPVSKQLMPVYDKPMIYYPLSLLMLCGIREILIITTPEDRPLFEKLLGSGEQWGLQLSYCVQPHPGGLAQAYLLGEEFLDGAPSTLVLGDNLFYGHLLSQTLEKAAANTEGATIFGYHVANPSAYGVASFDASGKVIDLQEKPEKPASSYAIPGVYFYDHRASAFTHQLKPSPRGELEITDLNRCYLEEGTLRLEILGRGIAWLDTGTHDSLLDAANFVQVIEKRQGFKISCLEEIACRKGWLSREELAQRLQNAPRSSYYEYLRNWINSPDPRSAAL